NFFEFYCDRKKRHNLIHLLKSGVIIDTKVLVMYLVGFYDTINNTDYLNRFSISRDEYKTLIKFKEEMEIENFIVTPYILTEVYNEIQNKTNKDFIKKIIKIMRLLIKEYPEKYYEKNLIMERNKFGDFDFSDIANFLATEEELHLLTKDRPVCGICKPNNAFAIHMEDLMGVQSGIR
ncbi:MAG: hypothetical protein KAT37_05085, partial [Candidatus Aenigmarchaeota archaeon]|nr:hypothetical protein [Candidatus Aenigmarchaeota archaeon]